MPSLLMMENTQGLWIFWARIYNHISFCNCSAVQNFVYIFAGIFMYLISEKGKMNKPSFTVPVKKESIQSVIKVIRRQKVPTFNPPGVAPLHPPGVPTLHPPGVPNLHPPDVTSKQTPDVSPLRPPGVAPQLYPDVCYPAIS